MRRRNGMASRPRNMDAALRAGLMTTQVSARHLNLRDGADEKVAGGSVDSRSVGGARGPDAAAGSPPRAGVHAPPNVIRHSAEAHHLFHPQDHRTLLDVDAVMVPTASPAAHYIAMQSPLDGSQWPGLPTDQPPRRKQKFRGGVPYATALFQALVVAAYAAFLWVPHPVSCSSCPWYTHLGYRISGHGVVYTLVGLVGIYIFYSHKRSQARGYLRFYRSINMLRRFPIFTMSIVNVLLLVLFAMHVEDVVTTPAADMILNILVSVEAAIVLPCFMRYSWRVREHNNSTPVPDVEQVMSPSFETSPQEGDIDSPLAGGQVVQRWQADLLRWQQVKITDLQRQVLSLVESNQVLEQQNQHLGSHGTEERSSGLLAAESSESSGDLVSSVRSSTSVGSGGRKSESAVQRLQAQLREERRRSRRIEQALRVEKEMNREAQRVIESMHDLAYMSHTSDGSPHRTSD